MNHHLTHHIITDDEKRAICAWKYPGEYAVYDLPPYEVMAQRKISFLNPAREKNFRTFYAGDTLVGFVNIKEEGKEVFIAIGVHPDHCDQGYGQQMLAETCRIADALYPGKPLCLEVRTWNARAIRCYQKAGFVIEGEAYELMTLSGSSMFYRMVKDRA